MYKLRQFRAAFCLETLEELRVEGLHALVLKTREAVVGGIYDFLPYPPLVFSRTQTKYNRLMASEGYSYG